MKSLRFPHPLVLLTLFIILAAGLSHGLPAGQFARRPNAATGRAVVVPGSYQRVPPPVGLLDVAAAVARGLAAAGAVVFLVFLAGGAFTVVGMMGAQVAPHLPVPSVSGQAVLIRPLLVPLSDLIGRPRRVAVLAYQYGAGLTDLLTPTNGALMAMLAATGVRYDQWRRFAGPLYGLLLALGAGAVLLGIWLKLG